MIGYGEAISVRVTKTTESEIDKVRAVVYSKTYW